MSHPIDDETLAGLYEVARPASAAVFRERADRERAAGRADVEALADNITALLDTVGAVAARCAKNGHTAECHKTSARCLADRVRSLLTDD